MPRSMSITISEVSPVSHSRPGKAPLMAPARFLSETPRVVLFFLPDFGRLTSSKDKRKSDAMPSETSFAFSRACAAPLHRIISFWSF